MQLMACSLDRPPNTTATRGLVGGVVLGCWLGWELVSSVIADRPYLQACG